MEKISFCISAPGKIILHGEHSVVYGKPALAASIGLRTYINLVENDSSLINIKFPNLNTCLSVPLNEANKFLEEKQTKQIKLEENNAEYFKNLEELINKHSVSDRPQVMALTSTFYLLFKIFSSEDLNIKKGFEINLKSDLQMGAGLGSSASFNICLAASFLILSKKILKKDKEYDFSVDNKNLISDWALKAEKIMHCNPSGVDNTVCSFGNIIKFQKLLGFEKIILKSKLNVLLVDSNVVRSTLDLVEKVAKLNVKLPKVTSFIFDALEEIVISAIPIYENYMHENVDDIEQLKEIFQINNDLLKAIGVSHTKLEEIFSISSKHKFSSKLTGAGGGGYAIVLLPNNYKNEINFKNLCNDLKANNFAFFETTVGDEGIKIEDDSKMMN